MAERLVKGTEVMFVADGIIGGVRIAKFRKGVVLAGRQVVPDEKGKRFEYRVALVGGDVIVSCSSADIVEYSKQPPSDESANAGTW